MRHHESKQRIVKREIELFFETEVVDERLEDVELTDVVLSSDQRYLTVKFLAPAGREGEAQAALDELRQEVRERVAGLLRQAPDMRLVLDKGAANKRRVDEILRELADEPQQKRE